MTTIGRQANDTRKTDGEENLCFRTLGVMKRRENIKVVIRRMDSITIRKFFFSLRREVKIIIKSSGNY